MENFFETLQTNVPFIVIMIVIYLLGLVFFWYESKSTGKNKNSIFDMWFFMSIIMLIWGRVTYIITNWAFFAEWDWFWLPYERYGDALYVFRAMPWRLFKFWDGGFLFIPMFIAYLIAGYIYTVFVKKWRWRDMFVSVVFSANFLLGTTLFFYGIYIDNSQISRDGFLIVLFILASHVLINILKYVYRNNRSAYLKVKNVYMFIFLIANFAFLGYTFAQQEISNLERNHVVALLVVGIIFLISYILDVRNPDKTKDKGGSSESYSSVSLNQAIKVR